MKQVTFERLELWAEANLDTLSNVTSVGTLTSLTVDNIYIDGNTIGHTSDTDLLTITGGSLTVAGSLTVDDNFLYINGALAHNGDADTKLVFSDNEITLRAGGTDYLEITSAGTNFADTDVVRPKLKDYSETVHAVGTVTTSTALDFENGNVQTVTTSGFALVNPLVYSLTNPPASGIAGTMTVIFTNGSASTSSFHSSIIWPGGVEPTLSASGVDVISFLTTDGGTTYYGFVGGLNFS